MRDPDVSVDLQVHLENREKEISNDILLAALHKGNLKVGIAAVVHRDAFGKETIPFYTTEYGDMNGLEQAMMFKSYADHHLEPSELLRVVEWSLPLQHLEKTKPGKET